MKAMAERNVIRISFSGIGNLCHSTNYLCYSTNYPNDCNVFGHSFWLAYKFIELVILCILYCLTPTR